jgi:Fe-S cluster biogenesis protein NfuA
MDHFVSGRSCAWRRQRRCDETDEADIVYEGEAADIVKELKEIIDARVRPAVARDGGDITFHSWDHDQGIVRLNMRGSCAGCPSSTLTLKQGIENMLRHYVPEVLSVEQVA